MKAIILDMYGVIIKQTGGEFAPYVQRFFPDLRAEEIEKTWFQADLGEISSLEVWASLGFQGNLEAVEREYLDTLELFSRACRDAWPVKTRNDLRQRA